MVYMFSLGRGGPPIALKPGSLNDLPEIALVKMLTWLQKNFGFGSLQFWQKNPVFGFGSVIVTALYL